MKKGFMLLTAAHLKPKNELVGISQEQYTGTQYVLNREKNSGKNYGHCNYFLWNLN